MIVQAQGSTRAYEPTVTPRVANNNFIVDRDLEAYRTLFGPDFDAALARLKNGGAWLDSGSGYVRPQIELSNECPHLRGKLVSLTYKIPTLEDLVRSQPTYQLALSLELRKDIDRVEGRHRAFIADIEAKRASGRIRMVVDRLLESYHPRADAIGAPGSFTLITDCHGPITYTRELSNVLTIYGRLLAPGGDLFITVVEGPRALSLGGTTMRRYLETGSGFEIVGTRRSPQGETCFHLRRNQNDLRLAPTRLAVEDDRTNKREHTIARP